MYSLKIDPRASVEKNLESILSQCCIVDIETSAFYPNGEEINIQSDFENYLKYAQVKWIGFYSFKYQKTFIFNTLTKTSATTALQEKHISELFSEHPILIGHNIQDFDLPILINNKFIIDPKEYMTLDTMVILGKSSFRTKDGFPYKNRATLMEVDLDSNSLKNMAKAFGLDVQKGDIDYRIFQKDIWSHEETQEIITYLKGDLLSTKGLFDKLWNYWKPFTQFLPNKSIYDLSWIKSSIASVIYKSACHMLGEEPTYAEKGGLTEEVGGNVYLPSVEEETDVFICDFASLYPHMFCLFNLFSEMDSGFSGKYVWNGNDVFKVQGYYDSSRPSTLSKLVIDFLQKRTELKKNDPKNPLIYTYKIFLNGLYGVVRSKIFEKVHKPNAGADCCLLGQQCQGLMDSMLTEFGWKRTAGDSITKETKVYHTELKNIEIEKLWSLNNNSIYYRENKEIKLWDKGQILTSDNNFKNCFQTPVEIIRHKCNKKIYKLEFTSQEYLNVTEDHSLIGLNEYNEYINVYPKDLINKKIKYILFNRQKLQVKQNSLNLQKEMYNLAGMIIANGFIEPYSIGLSFEYIKEYYENIISKISIEHKIQKKNKITDIRLASKELAYLYQDLGFKGNSKTKKIPDFLFLETKENICEFLKGCMTGDGTVMLRNNNPTIRYTSINEILIDDLRELFYLVGIGTSKIKEKTTNNYNGVDSGTYSYHIYILDRKRYANQIGFSCKAKNDLIKNFPFQQLIGIHKNESKEYSGKKSYSEHNRDFNIRHVKSIVEIDYNDYVYDISIPNYEKFYANDVLVHNTDSWMGKHNNPTKNTKEYLRECLDKVVQKIKDNAPFKVDTFDIVIEKKVDYIMFSFSEQPIVGEDGKNLKVKNRLVKERKAKKKNYLFIHENKGVKEIEIKGLPIIKDNATKLGMDIYENVLKKKIIEQNRAKFLKEDIDTIINDYLKKPDILDTISVEYKVKSLSSYKTGNPIHAQISKAYFGGNDGVIRLIKNNKIGKVGKSKVKYCSVEEAQEAKLLAEDLDLTKLYEELSPFILFTPEMEKLNEE